MKGLEAGFQWNFYDFYWNAQEAVFKKLVRGFNGMVRGWFLEEFYRIVIVVLRGSF